MDTVTPEAVQKAHKARARLEFYKLRSTVSNLRLLAPSVRVRQNTLKVDGQWTTSMDGDFLINDAALLQAALDAEKITGDDVALYSAFGDPFTAVAQRYEELGLEVPRGMWPSTRFIWAVADRDNGDETVRIFESSKTFAEAIQALLDGDYPDLFSYDTGFDIKVVGNGKDGVARRYQPPVTARESSELGWEPTIPNLVRFAIRGAVPFQTRVEQLFAAKGDQAVEVGFRPSSFGVEIADGDNE